jgi:hypothetical protein
VHEQAGHCASAVTPGLPSHRPDRRRHMLGSVPRRARHDAVRLRRTHVDRPQEPFQTCLTASTHVRRDRPTPRVRAGPVRDPHSRRTPVERAAPACAPVVDDRPMPQACGAERRRSVDRGCSDCNAGHVPSHGPSAAAISGGNVNLATRAPMCAERSVGLVPAFLRRRTARGAEGALAPAGILRG